MTASSSDDADLRWLAEAISLSRRCPPSAAAFAVGAVLVGPGDCVIATGFSRETDPADHAEEVTLARAAAAGLAGQRVAERGPVGHGVAERGPAGPDLAGATLFTSLEPCLRRASRQRSCAELIVAAGIGRVVVAWLEPPVFAPGGGAAWLRRHGVTVVHRAELADEARAVNAGLPL